MPHSSHRHSVVLPLLALSVLGTAVVALPAGQNGLTAVTAAGETNAVFTLDSGMRGMSLPGAQTDLVVDPPVLEEGSALIAMESPTKLQVGPFTLTAIGGGYYVTKSGDAVTVAALTTPVLISLGAARVAVPAGMQWRVHGDALARWDSGIDAWMEARKVTALPERFLLEQQERLRALPQHDLLPAPEAHVGAFAEGNGTELPEALSRRKEKWVEQVLGVLRTAVEKDDAAAVQEIFLRPELADAFSAVRAQSVISSLLFSTPRTVALQQQLLPPLVADPDLWLLLSLQPSVSTVVWTLPAPDHSSEAEAVRLLAFPFADIRGEAGNEVSWERWQQSVLASVFAAKDPVLIVDALIVRLGKLAVDREQEGYPERARFIVQTLQAIHERLQGSALSTEATQTLQVISQFDRVGIVSSQESASSVSVDSHAASSAPADAFDPAATESQARLLLQRTGAAFSLETRIIPVDARHALIENIVYAGSSRDHTLTFTLNVERAEVSGIHEGTQEYPYALGMEAFMEWIRK